MLIMGKTREKVKKKINAAVEFHFAERALS